MIDNKDESTTFGSQLKLHPTIYPGNVEWEKRERTDRHSFKKPDEHCPFWLVHCPQHGLEFSTANWDQGLCERNTCLYCRKLISYKHG